MFSGKVVLITGSSSGIGAGAAIHFTKLGARVTITGRNVEKLNKVAAQCELISKMAPLVLVGDVCDDEFLKQLVQRTIDYYKKLDILINNAAYPPHGTLVSTSFQEYKKTMDTNLRSIFYLTSLAIPYLEETKGNIVNISSIAGTRPVPGMISYNMSKAGLDHYTRCLALELARKQVRVNAVSPGPVYTDISINKGLTVEQSNKVYEHLKKAVPLNFIASVEDIVPVIAFLADEKSKFITGAVLPVGGGQDLGSSGTIDLTDRTALYSS